MAEQTEAENIVDESEEGGSNQNIYDSVFHTIVQNLPQLLIALINLTFGKDYPEDITITHLKETHHRKTGNTRTDCFLLIGEATYHIECQTRHDGVMALRMFEYDMAIALEEAWQKQVEKIRMPSSCVIYLSHTKNTPDVYRLTILGQDDQRMEYRCPVIKVQNYSLDELFEKNLLMLLPFYIMRYESKFPDMEKDDDLRRQFLDEVAALSDRLEKTVSPDDKAGVYQDLIQLITDIAKYELKAYRNTLEGVTTIMEARILPLPSDSLRAAERRGVARGIEQGIEKGIEQGIEQGIGRGRKEGEKTMFNSMVRTMYEKGCSVLQIASLTDNSEEAIKDALRMQGLVS